MKREDVQKIFKAFGLPTLDEIAKTNPWLAQGASEVPFMEEELGFQEEMIAKILLIAAEKIPKKLLRETPHGNLFVWVDKPVFSMRPHWLSCTGHRVRIFPPNKPGLNWTVHLEAVPHRALLEHDEMYVVDTSSCPDEALAWEMADGFVMGISNHWGAISQ